MKKVSILLCILFTVTICMSGCYEDAKHIGNPYVPEYFTLDGVDYHMEYDNIPQKLEENGWLFATEGKTVIVYKDVEYQKNKSQKGYYHSEFTMILRKNSSVYNTPSEYVVTNIIFDVGKLLVDFHVKGIELNTIYEDTHRKFGESGDIGYKEGSHVPYTLTYTGKTRAMVATFENHRLIQYNFYM